MKRNEVKEQLAKIHRAVKDLKRTGLNERAIVVLLQAATKLQKRHILAVLDGIESLEELYATEEEKP